MKSKLSIEQNSCDGFMKIYIIQLNIPYIHQNISQIVYTIVIGNMHLAVISLRVMRDVVSWPPELPLDKIHFLT